MKTKDLARLSALSGMASNSKLDEWANSPNGNYADRGQMIEPPTGPAISNSLRDYVGGTPMKVTVETDDITESVMQARYNRFKKSIK
jgi:hypothetical protein